MTTIHFTVSMWNRFKHLEMLLQNLAEVAEKDSHIALHVCAFPGKDATFEQLQELVRDAKVPVYLNYRLDSFGNGLGHNVAAGGVPRPDIICPVTVDIVLPPNITERIRAHTVLKESFYFPQMYQMCADGTKRCGPGGGALVSLYKWDWYLAGGLWPDRAPYGGDRSRGKGEDELFRKKLIRMGLKEKRPKERDLYCRHHKRWLSNPFYSTLKGVEAKYLTPWMTIGGLND